MKTATREIRRCNGYRIGQEVELDGRRCTIERFPTRSTVVVRAADAAQDAWVTTEVLIGEISRV